MPCRKSHKPTSAVSPSLGRDADTGLCPLAYHSRPRDRLDTSWRQRHKPIRSGVTRDAAACLSVLRLARTLFGFFFGKSSRCCHSLSDHTTRCGLGHQTISGSSVFFMAPASLGLHAQPALRSQRLSALGENRASVCWFYVQTS